MNENYDYYHRLYIDGKLQISDLQRKAWQQALDLLSAININQIQGLAWNDMGLPKDNQISQYLSIANDALRKAFKEISDVVYRMDQDEIIWKHFSGDQK